MFKRLPPDPGGLVEAPVEKNVILALREQSINTARRGGWGGGNHIVFRGKEVGISLHQQIRRGGETVKNRLAITANREEGDIRMSQSLRGGIRYIFLMTQPKLCNRSKR